MTKFISSLVLCFGLGSIILHSQTQNQMLEQAIIRAGDNSVNAKKAAILTMTAQAKSTATPTPNKSASLTSTATASPTPTPTIDISKITPTITPKVP